MKFKTDKILGGLNIAGIKFNKTTKPETAKMGNIQMTGVYSSGGELTIKPKPSYTVPEEIDKKYSEVAFTYTKGYKPLSEEIKNQEINDVDRASDKYLEEQPEFA